MDYIVQLFGDVTLANVLIFIAAAVFLYKCYKKIEKYFTDKAIDDKKKSEEMQKVMEQAGQNQKWHQESIEIRDKLNDDIKSLGSKIDAILDSLSELREESREVDATNCRYRILRFNDEILHRQGHSEEHFNQILSDIDSYNEYCRDHPDYKNSKAVCAIQNIKDTYSKCVKENSFL